MGVAFSALAESFQHLSTTLEKVSNLELLGEVARNIGSLVDAILESREQAEFCVGYLKGYLKGELEEKEELERSLRRRANR